MGHGLTSLGCSVVAGGDFAARLVEHCLHLIGQFKLVFQIVVKARPQLFEFRPRISFQCLDISTQGF